MKRKLLPIVCSLAGIAMVSTEAHALTFDGIEFPQGAISFADSVVSYDPGFSGGAEPTDANYLDPQEALGTPDYSSPYGSVSLGSGGRIILRFIDNVLTGSDDSDADLHIFEIGPDVEDTFVDISKNGIDWFGVGKVFGSTSSIDIDAFGFTSSDYFSYVRLTDDPNEGGRSGSTVGADIDAVGAITTTAANAVPDTGVSTIMAGLSVLGLAAIRRRLKA